MEGLPRSGSRGRGPPRAHRGRGRRVVGDVAGFVAASYARGIALVTFPQLSWRSSLAPSAKTGVNLRRKESWARLSAEGGGRSGMPTSLPPRDFRSGIYEIINAA